MKQGKFITSSEYMTREYEHPWHVKNPRNNFNTYEKQLENQGGILTVKKEFSVDQKVKSVKVRATSLGIFDIYLNGELIGEDEYKPGWTDYRLRVFEFEYDITNYIDKENLFVAEVAPGWWTGGISFGFYGYKPTAFCGEIEITYTNGKKELIATDDSWDATVAGPVLTAQIWEGEMYDARIPHASIAPEKHNWKKAVLQDYEGKIEPAHGGRILHLDDFSPISAVLHEGIKDNGTDFGEINVISKKVGTDCEACTIKKGQALICDFGQNMVGRPIVSIKAKKGTRVELFVAEMLNDSGLKSRGNDGPKGGMYILNYRTAIARTVYFANGEDDYIESRHSFFGFRYLEIRTDADIEIEYVLGNRIGSDVYSDHLSNFFCSNPEVNKLYSNITNGMKGNYLSVPTDCPQRNERLGWTCDTQVFAPAASYIGDTHDFLRKWLVDVEDSQYGYDGAVCAVCPRVWPEHNNDSAWADATIVVPDILYRMYNDIDVVKSHYASMEAYMKSISQYGMLGPNDTYADWLNYEITDKRYVSVCYYAYDALLMEKYSALLGKTRREAHYRNLYKKIRNYWKNTYTKNGKLLVDTQTGYLLAIKFGLAQGNMRENFIKRLKKKIVDNNYTLSTGFVGTAILCQTLDEIGLTDLSYSLLLQTADPSWLYSVRQGATTVWERWNSYTLEKGFGDVNMNSFNHYAYGAVAEWMYAGICGIRPDPENPGFETDFVLAPTPDFRKDKDIPVGQTRLTSAFADYETITSGWEFVNGETVYSFEFYDGLTAHVSIVCPDGKLNVNGIDMDVSDLNGKVENGRAIFDLSEGYYKIKVNN